MSDIGPYLAGTWRSGLPDQLLVYERKALFYLFYCDAGEEVTDIKRDEALIFIYLDLGPFVYEGPHCSGGGGVFFLP